MRVLLVTRFYPPDTGGGGIAAYAYYLAHGLQRAGHSVRVISRMAAHSQPTQVVEGVEVSRIQALTFPYRFRRVPVAGAYLRFCNDLLYAAAVRKQLLHLTTDFRPDLVEYADIDAESFFHPFEVSPAVIKLHTPHFVLKRFYNNVETPYDTTSICWLEKKAILSANGLSSPSRYLAKAVAQEYGLNPRGIIQVPNPIDTDFFSPGYQLDESTPTVLYVGRLERRKGVITFAHAVPLIAQRYPQVRFVLLGADRSSPTGGSEQAELMAFFREQGVEHRVEFRGHAAPEVFREYYRRATVFVMPSLFENCPYTLLEAMSCGRAVVVSRAYGMKEMIIDGESGLFFMPGDAADLAEKVLLLLHDRLLRTKLGRSARATVQERYALDVATRQTISFYEMVLDQR